MDEILKDDRFSHILTDPSFRRIPKKVRKIKVDNRFKKLLKDKKFKEKCNVDERGCALKLDSSENLRKLYNMEENSSDSDDDSDENEIEKAKKSTKGNKKKSKEKKDKNLNDNIEDQNNENSLKKFNDVTTIRKEKNENQKIKCEDKSASISENDKKINRNINDDVNDLSQKNAMDINLNNSLNKSVGKRKEPSSPKTDHRFQLDSENESSSEGESDNDSKNLQIAYENEDSSEDDSDESSDNDDSESKTSDTFDHQWEEQHERAPNTDEITKRLAVCHMDWDRIRAIDLYAVFNSFKPPDSSILSVKIYPSEFGLKRMEEEKLNGPCELVEKTLASDEEEDKKGSKYHREKLRQYQMNRLKYYYAVVECDTAETANYLYEQLNGMEYESSSVRFDLRFIPDDMAFDQEPTSTAENPNLNEYKPKLFVTTALQQVKVGLTWDETDPQRREILQKAFTEPDDIEKDIQQYLASSSEESEEEVADDKKENEKLSTKERIQKYKALLESINQQEKEKNGEKYEMEITWKSGAKEETENLVKEKLEEKSYTPFEELQKKKKEKQKLKKKAKKATTSEPIDDDLSDSSSDASVEMKTSNIKNKNSKTNDELYLIADAQKIDAENEHSTVRKKKKKVKQETENDFQVDINDPRFSNIYTSPLYNVDPSDPHFKSTPGNLAIIAEKQRRLKNKNGSTEETKIKKKMKYS